MRSATKLVLLSLLCAAGISPARAQQIDLTQQVQGVLPVGNGGIGQNWSSASGLPQLNGGAFSLFNSDCSGANQALTYSGTTHTYGCTTISGGGGGAVAQVSNSDGTLVISPITGNVLASINLAHANTWTALQTFTSGIASGSAAPAVTGGSGGGIFGGEGTAPAAGFPGTGVDGCYADSASHTFLCSYNGGPLFSLAPGGSTGNLQYRTAGGGFGGDSSTSDDGAGNIGAASLTVANTMVFKGASSGQVTVQAQAAAGNPAIQWPTVSGQVALTSAEVVSFSSTPTFTPGDTMSRMILTGSVTSFTLGSTASGQGHVLCFEQGSGSYTVTAPANVHGFQPIGTTSGKWNCQAFMYDASDAIWLAAGPMVTNQ